MVAVKVPLVGLLLMAVGAVGAAELQPVLALAVSLLLVVLEAQVVLQQMMVLLEQPRAVEVGVLETVLLLVLVRQEKSDLHGGNYERRKSLRSS